MIPLAGAAMKDVEDRMDAVMCAYVGAHWWHWGTERNLVCGSAQEGYIVSSPPGGSGFPVKRKVPDAAYKSAQSTLSALAVPRLTVYYRNLCMKALYDSLKPGEGDWQLAQSIDPERLPAHIAIIMDGNGRWANRRSMPRVAGHRAGIDPVRNTVETCARLGITALTLYAFSVENWKRPRHEVETLWRLLRFYLRRELPDLMENDIRLAAIGRLDALPRQVRQELEAAMTATSGNTGLIVNLAINYGGRAENWSMP